MLNNAHGNGHLLGAEHYVCLLFLGTSQNLHGEAFITFLLWVSHLGLKKGKQPSQGHTTQMCLCQICDQIWFSPGLWLTHRTCSLILE